MDASEVAWAAGIFEGEGSFYLQRNKSSSRAPIVILKVLMADEDIIKRLPAATGVGHTGGPFYDQRNEAYKPMWQWITYGSNAYAVVRLFWSWLGQRRREQALVAWRDEAALRNERQVRTGHYWKGG